MNYSPVADRLMRRGHSSEAVPLRQVVSALGISYGNVFTRRDCEDGSGVTLLSQVDLFAAEPIGRTIRRDSMPFAQQHFIEPGDILLAGAGQVGETTLFGRATISDARLAGRYVDGHAVQLRFADAFSELSCFVYAYLASPVGLQLVRSTAYGTSVPGVRVDLLGELPVPRVHSSLLKIVAGQIRRAVKERERFATELLAARAPIEGLPEMQRARASCAARRPRAGVQSGRLPTLTGKTYVGAGAALPLLREVWGNRIGDVVPENEIYGGSIRFRTPCEPPYGIDFLTQRDAFLLRPVPQRIAHPGFDDRGLFVRPGALLIGGAGTLGEGEIFGRAVYVSDGMSRFAITQDLLRMVPREGEEPILYAFLSTSVGRRLLRSTGVGTKLLRMRADLIRALPLPDVDAATRRAVESHLREAMLARDAADRAEAEAIRIVETEVIPAWLS